MATHDYVIANGTGAAVRSDLNGALAAIVSNNSSATQPATMYAYQWWADTTTGLLKIRNSANSAWITLFQLDGEWTTLPIENGTAAAPSIYFKDSGTDTGFYSPGADQLGVSTGGTSRILFDASGRLLVNTTTVSSGSILQVDAGSNVAEFHHTSSSDTIGIYMRHGRGLSGFTGKMITFRRNDNTEVGSVVIGESSTTYATSSDYRLKENLVPLTGAIERINDLNVYRFNFKVNLGRTVDGFLAHEAQAVVPECVTGEKDAVDDDGNPVYQGIDQSKLVPLLTAALQEAIAKIEALETRLSALEAA